MINHAADLEIGVHLPDDVWHNELIVEQARKRRLLVLSQEGNTLVDELCDMILMDFGKSNLLI